MLRTALQTACRRLVARQQLVSPLAQSTRSLCSGPLRGVVGVNSNVHQNLSLSAVAAQPKTTQYQAIRSTSSDGKTGGENTTNLTVHDRIDKMIKDSKKQAFLFMKGIPEAPQCGYSNAVVQILDAYGVEYDSFDVLSDEEVRKEIKSYSNWPTIPQLYVDKTFVGGCDILIQMHQNNELEQLFKSKIDEAK